MMNLPLFNLRLPGESLLTSDTLLYHQGPAYHSPGSAKSFYQLK
jgi:hypothetical protein